MAQSMFLLLGFCILGRLCFVGGAIPPTTVLPPTWCDSIDLTDDSAIAHALRLEVFCENNTIIVVIDTCILERMKYDPEQDISLIGVSKSLGFSSPQCPSAVIHYDGASMTLTITITGDLTACNTNAKKVGDYLEYANAVRSINYSNVGGSMIIRRKDILLPFKCIYPVVLEDRSKYLDPIIGDASGSGQGSADGDFEPLVQLCTAITCAAGEVIANGQQVEVLTMIYLVITTTKDLNIIIDNVWANNQDSSKRYDLVQNGCNVDKTGPLVNNRQYKVSLCFLFFYWDADPTEMVFINVEYTLCDSYFQTCKDPDCDKRKRRDAGKSLDYTMTATIGPFRIKVK